MMGRKWPQTHTKERKMSPKPSSEPDGHDLNTESALFRYGLIAPLIHDPPPPGQQERRLREIAAKTYTIPSSTRTRVSVTTLRRYLKAYREGGFDALRPRPRADKGHPRAFPPEVLDQAVALREAQPSRTTQTLVDILARDEHLDLDRPLNVHTLTTHLRQRGKTRRLLTQTTQTARRFERAHVNDLWQGDAMHGPWLPDPDRPGNKRRTHLFCFIDDHSRLVPHAQFFFDEALPRMERVLKVGILRRGLPKAIYVDNGMVYSSTQFAAACATLGIQRIKASPYSPQAKGKQERLFATLRAQFLPEVEASDIATLADLNDALLAWIECVYHRHVHSTTQQTPLDRYAAGLEHVRPADAETLRLAFLWRETRKVRRNATISLQNNTYRVDPALAGQTIDLRFDPFDLSHIDLYLGDRHLGTAAVTVQNRQRHLQVERLVTEPPDPPKPQSSLDFLAALRQEYHAQQRQELGPLHFSRLADPDDPDETDDSQED
jgi:transposase InsO family protein